MMMMFPKSMMQRINSNAKGKKDHPSFKGQVMYDVDSKQR